MLVLSRKLQQQIKIGDQITVTVLRVKGNTVRIGVQAPREVRVIRGELPKSCETADVDAPLVSEAVIAITGDDVSQTAEASDDATDRTANQEQQIASVRPLAAAAHLPLRRIRHRHGRGPLQQIIATSAALAK